jgi:uncharacterized membrane protein YadS
MLGPVVIFLALTHRNSAETSAQPRAHAKLSRFVPWFISGFLSFAALRSLGVIPVAVASVMKDASTWLTIAAMAALGLGVDLKALGRVGRPVIITVVASLLVLLTLSVTLIRLLAIR